MQKRTFILSWFLLCSSLHATNYRLSMVVRDPSNRWLLVVQSKQAPLSNQKPSFPSIIRLDPRGYPDRTFGINGIISFKQWNNLPQVYIADIKFSPSGEMYVLGWGTKPIAPELSPEQIAIRDKLRISQNQGDNSESRELFANFFSLESDPLDYMERFEEQKQRELVDLFVSKFSPDGKPANFGGDGSGTATVREVPGGGLSQARALALNPSGGVAFLVEQFNFEDPTAMVGFLDSSGRMVDIGGDRFYSIDSSSFRTPKTIDSLWLPTNLWFDGKGIRVLTSLESFDKNEGVEQAHLSKIAYSIVQIPTSQESEMGPVFDVEITKLTEDVYQIAPSPDGKFLFVVATRGTQQIDDITIRKYEVASGKLVATFNGIGSSLGLASVANIAVDGDGALLVAGKSDSQREVLAVIPFDGQLRQNKPASIASVFTKPSTARDMTCGSVWSKLLDE